MNQKIGIGRLIGFPFRVWARHRLVVDGKRGAELLRKSFNLKRLAGVRVTRDEVILQLQDGREFVWNPAHANALLTLPTQGAFEERESEFARYWLRRDDIVVDCGANFGWYAVLFGALVGAGGEVHCFEPVPDAARQLERNVHLNSLAAVVRINKSALGDSVRKTEMWIPTREGAGTAFASMKKQDWGRHVRLECNVTTLYEYARSAGLARVDFVKCDVEGAELLVLRGAQELLRQGMRPAWMLEIAPQLMRRFAYGLQDAVDFLRTFDYLLCRLDEAGRPFALAANAQFSGIHNLVAVPREQAVIGGTGIPIQRCMSAVA